MGIKGLITVAKVVIIAGTVVVPAIEVTSTVTKKAVKFVKVKMNNSEKIQEIKRDFELRKDGVITVDYIEC